MHQWNRFHLLWRSIWLFKLVKGWILGYNIIHWLASRALNHNICISGVESIQKLIFTFQVNHFMKKLIERKTSVIGIIYFFEQLFHQIYHCIHPFINDFDWTVIKMLCQFKKFIQTLTGQHCDNIYLKGTYALSLRTQILSMLVNVIFGRKELIELWQCIAQRDFYFNTQNSNY